VTAEWIKGHRLDQEVPQSHLASEVYGYPKGGNERGEALSLVSLVEEALEQSPPTGGRLSRRIVHRNSTTGITTVREADGSTTQSFANSQGDQFESRTNADGTVVFFRDSTGSWRSNDGRNWVNVETQERQVANRFIDQYGQCVVRPEGGEQRVTGRSRQLERILTRQRELSNRYGVIFAEPGEGVAESSSGRRFACRPPTMAELNCLESVLDRNSQMNLRGLKICFAGSSRDGPVDVAGAYQHFGNAGRPQIVVFPSDDRPVLGWDGLEGLIHHELVHHEQRQNWGQQADWGARTAHRDTHNFLADLGWVYDAASGRHRLLDQEGNQWERERNAAGLDTGRWVPIVAGHPEPARAISNREMRERARVRPISDYFTTPAEMHAEALALFRQDRREMWLRCQRMPGGLAFYNLIARYDQQELDRNPSYGRQNERSRYIRNADGAIVPNTPANRQAVQDQLRGRRSAQPRQESSLNHNNICSPLAELQLA
jgi:hypothetical protein